MDMNKNLIQQMHFSKHAVHSPLVSLTAFFFIYKHLFSLDISNDSAASHDGGCCKVIPFTALVQKDEIFIFVNFMHAYLIVSWRQSVCGSWILP